MACREARSSTTPRLGGGAAALVTGPDRKSPGGGGSATSPLSDLMRIVAPMVRSRAQRTATPARVVARVAGEDGGSCTLSRPNQGCGVGEMMAVACRSNWYVVATRAGTVVAHEIPEGVGAVLLLADMERPDRALEELACLRDRKESIVVVLQWAPGFEAAAFARLQRDLCDAGADDVILNVGDPRCFEVAVTMSLERLQMEQVGFQALQRHLEERHREDLRRRLSQAEQRAETPTGMFWQVAHELFPGLPEMDAGLLEELHEGVRVGPCCLEGIVGKGGFSEVWSARNWQTGDSEAVKVVDKETLTDVEQVRALCREASVLGALDHPNVVGFRGLLHGGGYLFLRMELTGTSNVARALRAARGHFSTQVAQRLFRQLAAALAYVQEHGVAHRDVKPENLGISEDGRRVKLLDFGAAVDLHELRTDMAGTMPFMAPEILAAENVATYSPANVDVWSSGVLLLEMLGGLGKLNRMLDWPAKVAPNRQRQQDLIGYFARPTAIHEALQADIVEVDCNLVNLLQGMLEVDPGRRISAQETVSSHWSVFRCAGRSAAPAAFHQTQGCT